MLLFLAACVITEKDVQKRLDYDGDGFVHWEFEGGTDCDDQDPDVNPEAVDLCDGRDVNCDGRVEDLTDADGDGVTVCGGDCDDDDADRFPGAPEACDGKDNDCDGNVDEGLPENTFYADGDEDGYGDGAAPPVLACFPPEGYVDDDSDCDDTDASLNPDTTWYRDIDSDDYGDASVTRQSCEQPDVAGVLYVRDAGDCNDDDAAVNPGRVEVGDPDLVCNGVDDDCDPSTNPDELVDADGDGFLACADCAGDDDPHLRPDLVWWTDGDGDGFGAGAGTTGCPTTPHYVLAGGDCDDTDLALSPETVWYADADDDDYGDAATSVASCTDPSTAGHPFVSNDQDCDDTRQTVNPGSDDDGVRACNGIDDDCDPSTAPDELVDADQDGFLACEDCGNDDDGHVTPDLVWFTDGDGDGVGSGASQLGCPTGDWAPTGGDCDDSEPLVASTAIDLGSGASLASLLGVVCPGTTITLADGATFTESFVFDRAVTVTSAGSSTLVGALDVNADLTLDGLAITGDITAQDVDLSITAGSIEGRLDGTGGSVVLDGVTVDVDGATGHTFVGSLLTWTDVAFTSALEANGEVVSITNAAAGSRLLRVQVQGSGLPQQERVALRIVGQAPGGNAPIELRNVLVTSAAAGIQIVQHDAELSFVTIADYLTLGLDVSGDHSVTVGDTLIGRPVVPPEDPPPDYGAIAIESTVDASFNTTYLFLTDADQADGIAVDDPTGAWDTCAASFLPGPNGVGDGPALCEQVLDRTDVVDADLVVALPGSGGEPMDYLFGRISQLGTNCHGLDAPGPGTQGPPDDCFQAGYYGSLDGPPTP